MLGPWCQAQHPRNTPVFPVRPGREAHPELTPAQTRPCTETETGWWFFSEQLHSHLSPDKGKHKNLHGSVSKIIAPAGSWQRGLNRHLGGNKLAEIDHPIKTSV